MRTGGAAVYDPDNGRMDYTRTLGHGTTGRCKQNTMSENDDDKVQCPICGDTFKTSFYLGRHVSLSEDKAHSNVEGSNESPSDLGSRLGIDKDSEPRGNEGDKEPSDIEVDEIEAPSDDEPEYIDLDPSDDVDRQLMRQGYTQVKKSAVEAGEVSEGDLR